MIVPGGGAAPRGAGGAVQGVAQLGLHLRLRPGLLQRPHSRHLDSAEQSSMDIGVWLYHSIIIDNQ